jgi:hypothetical protein
VKIRDFTFYNRTSLSNEEVNKTIILGLLNGSVYASVIGLKGALRQGDSTLVETDLMTESKIREFKERFSDVLDTNA